MTNLTNRQINCIIDAKNNNGVLWRQKASSDFKGASAYHNSNTVKSMTDNGAFSVVALSQYGYPLTVKLNNQSGIVLNIDLIGKYVSYKYGRTGSNDSWPKTKVLGLALKKGELFFKYQTGSNHFAPVSSITKRW